MPLTAPDTETPVTPDMIIPPGGHAEICCDTFHLVKTGLVDGGNMSEALHEIMKQVNPDAITYYLALPVDERKKLEGLESGALTTAISELYDTFLLSHFKNPLPEPLKEVFLSLTKTEQAEIMRVGDQEFQEMMLTVRIPTPPIPDEAKQQANEFHSVIVSASENEQLRLFSPFPTELTRCSPFFPLSTQEMARRDYLEDLIIADHSWGQVRFTGQKLSVYDEDMLMILLAAINESNHVNSMEGYTYKGSLQHLLKLKGITNPGKNHRDEAFMSYKRMSGATFELDTSPKLTKGKTRGGKTTVTNIISNLSYDRKAGILSATVNPYFFEMYCRGAVTWIDVEIRTKLKSPISKALHRFVQSHQKDYWTGPLILLATSLNLDSDLPMNKVRERLKKAIAELVEFNVLQSASAIDNDQITLRRTPRKPARKLGEKEETSRGQLPQQSSAKAA